MALLDDEFNKTLYQAGLDKYGKFKGFLYGRDRRSIREQAKLLGVKPFGMIFAKDWLKTKHRKDYF